MNRVLIFTPYAGRTGSEMFLWYMLSHITPGKMAVTLVSESDGELLHQMPAGINTHVTLKYPDKFTRMKQLLMRLMGKNLYEEHLMQIHQQAKPDYWYLNTVLMTDKIHLARKHNIPVVAHFHELTNDYGLIKYNQLQETIEYASLCIGDSEAVCHKLKILGAKKIALQYECIDLCKINPSSIRSATIKEELGLNKFSFIWLMSGSSITRKGIDLVPELVKYLKAENHALVWLGNSSKTGTDLLVQRELEFNTLDNVFFLGKKSEDYYDYMNVMDGFVLTSREEPFGMVVVEALALGKPVISFNAGGVTEILTSDTGRIVNSWNVTDLADEMVNAVNDLSWFSPVSAKRRALDFDVSNQVKNWENILSTL